MEDDPHTIRVLLIDDDRDFAVLASTLLETESEHIETIIETNPRDALELVASDEIDCIVSDYRMPEMDGIELLETVREEHPNLPFILFTGKGDETVAKEALSVGVSDYIIKDGSSEQYAISANRIENLVRQYRDRKRAVRKRTIDTLFEAVVGAIVNEPTRDAIEREVCERLVSSELYSLAWIGRRNPQTGDIRPHASAGSDAFLDAVSFSTDRARPQAVEEGALANTEPQVATDFSDAGSGRWYDEVRNHGFEAAIGVPIVYETVPYGVLGVYTRRGDAFSPDEVSALRMIADLAALSIGASERRQGDTSRKFIEIDLDVENTTVPFVQIASTFDARVRLTQTIHRPDGTKLTVYTVEGVPPEQLRELDSLLGFDVARIAEQGESNTDVAVVSTDPWWEELVSLYGGNVGDGVADAEGATLRIELPLSADVRSVVDLIQSRYPGAELTARRERSRPKRSVGSFHSLFEARLTDRQREVIETAYRAGYYEWPHESSSQEVADMLGIAQPTFAEHFWTAQRRIAQLLFESNDTGGDGP